MNTLKIDSSNSSGWKNKGGTCDRECSCGPWKDHWKEISGEEFDGQTCSNKQCSEKAKHGAHVFHSGSNSKKEWIVPLCAKCNHSSNKEEFGLRSETILVNANKGETCENGN